jgi:putative transposase
VKYAWIAQHRDSFPISVMCDVLNVSPSGYYDSIDRPPSARAERHERIRQAVRQAHAESHGIYGSHKVAEVLQQREDLESACRNTVAVAMRELGLKSRVCKRFKPTTTQTDPTKQPAENTLDRDFTADAPNRKWVEEARLSVFRSIETFYNSVRLHETLNYLSPDPYEAENAPAVAA